MRLRPLLWGTAAAVVLTLTALAYQQPATLTQLAEQLWSCF